VNKYCIGEIAFADESNIKISDRYSMRIKKSN